MSSPSIEVLSTVNPNVTFDFISKSTSVPPMTSADQTATFTATVPEPDDMLLVLAIPGSVVALIIIVVMVAFIVRNKRTMSRNM